MKALLVLLSVVSGLSNPIQSAATAALNKGTQQPLITALVLYAVAVATLLPLVAGYALWRGLSLAPLREAAGELPWWVYIGGACNIVFVLVGAVATSKLGSGPFTVITLTAAVLLSIVLDSLGLMRLPVHPLTWPRMVGAALSIAGVMLVSLF